MRPTEPVRPSVEPRLQPGVKFEVPIRQAAQLIVSKPRLYKKLKFDCKSSLTHCSALLTLAVG